MKFISLLFLFTVFFGLTSCKDAPKAIPVVHSQETLPSKDSISHEQQTNTVAIEKEFLYNEHTLTDTYAYKDTVRVFQWEKIRYYLALIDSVQQTPCSWGILQNRHNINGEAPLVDTFYKNQYKRIADTFKVDRFQGIPLYHLNDSIKPKRYAIDGSLIKLTGDTATSFIKSSIVYFQQEYIIPKKYIKFIGDTTIFNKLIFVDRTNQNIATLEKINSKWVVRSMNPATTGLHKPPYMQETPLGIFVIQEKKIRMVYLEDNSTRTGGFSPYASRFSNGGYLHGIPVNRPATKIVEISSSLGTTPRSHMCVRNATSHAKFIYDWAPVEKSLVIVFD